MKVMILANSSSGLYEFRRELLEELIKNKTYIVKKGDCLYNIAKKELGDGARWKEIYNLNKDKIENPDLIYPDQKLTLPN